MSLQSNFPVDRTADSWYVEDARRIQANIQRLQEMTAYVSRLCTHPDERPDNFEKLVHEKMREAKQSALETQALLKRFSAVAGVSSTEKTQRRLTHQRLSQNYQQALKALETIAQTHFMREAMKLDKAAKRKESNVKIAAAAQKIEMCALRSTDSLSKDIPKSVLEMTHLNEDDWSVVEEGRLVLDELGFQPLVDDIQESSMKKRQEGLAVLQSDIANIHQLYQELSVHIDRQEAPIEMVSAYVHETVEQTTAANHQLGLAATYRRQHQM
eukprot:Platyproteum_vivax@DN6847_c0_g1_i2.p1